MFFRNGKAHRFADDRFILLDTSGYHSDGRPGLLFVLSLSNELYVGPWQYHSFPMAGGDVLCAGTIQIQNGTVTHIKNDSGHYKPVDVSLVKLLQHLQMNGVDPAKVTVDSVGLERRFEWKDGKLISDPKRRFRTTEGPTVKGNVFLAQHGNWESILKRASHQAFRRVTN